jgi:ubiquinone biosynthesis monooxygenase Coq7
VTGLAGRQAIVATTVAIERVVLSHMRAQVAALGGMDAEAVAALGDVIGDEQSHHDLSAARLDPKGFWPKLIDPLVAVSTHAVIWLGMRL